MNESNLELVTMSSSDLLRAASKKLLTVKAAEASAAAAASESPNPDDREEICWSFCLKSGLSYGLRFHSLEEDKFTYTYHRIKLEYQYYFQAIRNLSKFCPSVPQFPANARAPVDVGRGHAVQHDAAVTLDGLDRAQEGPCLQQAQFTFRVTFVSVLSSTLTSIIS